VYIFDDADNMQATAQNALLKVMEEPPEGVYFILTAKNKTVFLETILSRVTSIGLKKPNVAENTNQNVDSFFKAILSNDEYNALKAIFSVNNKDELLKFLRDTENSLTTYFDSSSCVKIYNYIRKCYRELTANTNIKLIMTNLVSDIFTR
jgi:DNA polymerase III gamma/tau subunit